MQWTDEFRKLGVRTNADTPEQVENAIGFGAEGIGLCRTEHMFFEGDRIDAMREMILAETTDERKKRLGQTASLPARGLHWNFHGIERLARHHSPP